MGTGGACAAGGSSPARQRSRSSPSTCSSGAAQHIFNRRTSGSSSASSRSCRTRARAARLLVGADVGVARARTRDHRRRRVRDPAATRATCASPSGSGSSFAAGLAIVAAAGHAMSARWHPRPHHGLPLLVGARDPSPEVLVFLFFMITDPKTAPREARARLVYAISIGLLGALLIAPTTTEFASKVALLGSLAIVCVAMPVLRMFLRDASCSAASCTRLPAGLALYAGVLVLVTTLGAAGRYGICAHFGCAASDPDRCLDRRAVTARPGNGRGSSRPGSSSPSPRPARVRFRCGSCRAPTRPTACGSAHRRHDLPLASGSRRPVGARLGHATAASRDNRRPVPSPRATA